MKLDRVTITGADDSIDPGDLVDLGRRFPFVEWGILLSKSQEGGPRFPSLDWMLRLKGMAMMTGGTLSPEMKLSGHLCGRWVRDLCRGNRAFEAERPGIARMFQRVQINFHAQAHEVNDLFPEVLRMWEREEYIFQFDDVNDLLMAQVAAAGVKCAPLFDTSGGAGIEPATWPSAERFAYSGYAGGLHPDRLVAQLARIADAAGDRRIWIDTETHVRSDADAKLDLDKVVKFLSAATPYVSVPDAD